MTKSNVESLRALLAALQQHQRPLPSPAAAGGAAAAGAAGTEEDSDDAASPVLG